MKAAVRIILACVTADILMVVAVAALANDDLILQDIRHINLNRPISIVVSNDLARVCPAHADACAPMAYSPLSRCIVYIRPDRLQFLYHEMQHCAGITHRPDGD